MRALDTPSFFKIKPTPEDKLPQVYVLMAVYNEAAVIIDKIKSIEAIDYPRDRLELIIASDQSDDGTDNLIKSYSTSLKLTLRRLPQRSGKPNAINQLVEFAQTQANFKDSILLLTDANVMLSEGSLRQLVYLFENPKIGLVDAAMHHIGIDKEQGVSASENTYINQESRLKIAEGHALGAMMGPFGGCFAMRAKLYVPVPFNFLVDDFFLSMNVLKQGYKTMSQPKAIVYEDVSHSLKEEFRRKKRISAGNWQNLKHFWPMIFKQPKVGFAFLSHKVFRWKTPIFLIQILGLLLIGVIKGWQGFLFAFLGLISLLLLPLLDLILQQLGYRSRILAAWTYFLAMNLALLLGLGRYIKGIKTNVWKPTKRHQHQA